MQNRTEDILARMRTLADAGMEHLMSKKLTSGQPSQNAPVSLMQSSIYVSEAPLRQLSSLDRLTSMDGQSLVQKTSEVTKASAVHWSTTDHQAGARNAGLVSRPRMSRT